MTNTRSKSSSAQNSENDTQMVSLNVVKELLKIHESSTKAFFSTFVEATDKRIDTIIKEVQGIKTSLEFTQSQVDQLVNLNLDEGLLNIQNEIDRLKDKVDDLENRSRRNNLCFDGIEETYKETWSNTEDKLKAILQDELEIYDVEIERAHRTGSKKEGKSRPVVAKFLKYKDREKVFKAKRKLKGSGIYIREDLSERVINKRKEMMPKLNEARENGKIAYFRFDKLIVHDPRPASTFGQRRGAVRGRGGPFINNGRGPPLQGAVSEHGGAFLNDGCETRCFHRWKS